MQVSNTVTITYRVDESPCFEFDFNTATLNHCHGNDPSVETIDRCHQALTTDVRLAQIILSALERKADPRLHHLRAIVSIAQAELKSHAELKNRKNGVELESPL